MIWVMLCNQVQGQKFIQGKKQQHFKCPVKACDFKSKTIMHHAITKHMAKAFKRHGKNAGE